MTDPLSRPERRLQPETLDSNPANEIKEDAPLAQGHSADDAAATREAQKEFTEAVQAAADADDVGPREPGDHASDKDIDKASEKASEKTYAKPKKGSD